MQPTVVYLIRHGEPDNPEKKFYGRFLDFGLSSIGKMQIHNLSKAIESKDGGLDVLFSSPLRRTKESASILSDAFAISYTTDDTLLETDSKGFEGKTLEEALALDISHLPEGISVEDSEQVAVRMERALREAIWRYPGKRIGFVSHGGPIAYCMQRLLQRKNEASLDPQKGNAWRLTFSSEGKLLDHEHILSVITKEKGNLQ